MKNLLIAASLILPMSFTGSLFGAEVKFSCTSVDYPGVHTFHGAGIVTIDDKNNVEGIITVNTQKAGAVQSQQSFDEVRVVGTIKRYAAGEFTKDAFDQLLLTTDEAYLKYLNLLLNFESKIASRVLSIDNFSYRADCKLD